MRIQFRKIDLQALDAIPENEQILFVEQRGKAFIHEYICTIESAKKNCMDRLQNLWTHWLILPKIQGKIKQQ